MTGSGEERAFAEARRICREAEASGAPELTFDFPEYELLRELPEELGRIQTLEWLKLSRCRHVTKVSCLAGLTSLRSLNLSGCRQVADFCDLAGLTALQALDVAGCEQIADFGFLAGLTSLQSLSLSGCAQIADLGFLAGLTALESLDLAGCERIADLGFLAGLTSLKSLALGSCEKIADFSVLARLTSLQSLDLSACEQIADLGALAGLTRLRSLNLSGCSQIADFGFLTGLTSLQSLDLSWCSQIGDPGPLAGLTSLRSLTLCGCTQIADAGALARLTSLQLLNLSGCVQIASFGFLEGLTSLETLYLARCVQIVELGFLARLTSLESLDLSWCRQIADLGVFAKLSSLRSLDLTGCGSVPECGPFEERLSGLSHIYLYDTQFRDLSTEICGRPGENVIEKVRAHYRDLRAGAAREAEVRVLALGNGGAGKTQMCQRLRGAEYDPAIPSTHGIQLGVTELHMEGDAGEIRLNLWDFGGQDIYHGSHSLFLSGHAVFVILWTPELENQAQYEKNGITLRHRPLSYWLDYVRAFAGNESPVIVVQSQCDKAAQRVHELPGGADGRGFPSFQKTQFSAKTDLGLDSLKAALKEGVRDLLARRPLPPIGAGRVRVRDRLREILRAGEKRWLERGEFDGLCAEEGGISDTEAFLDFLDHSGVVFYRRGLFGGRIVVDQNWALAAIYTIFDRNKSLPLLRNHGRFRRSDLEQFAWKGFGREEQEVFLGMMRSCGICFPVRRGRHTRDETEYIAPELLPGWDEAKESMLAGRLPASDPDAEARAEFGFLHEGVLRAYLSAIGTRAGDAAEYWKYGCWFYEKTTDSRALIESRWENAEAESGPGAIVLRAWGRGARQLLDPLVGALDRVSMGPRPRVEWTGVRPDGAALREPRGMAGPRDAGELGGLEIVETVLPPAGKATIYVSCAWEDDASEEEQRRGEVVDGACRVCGEEGWKVFRDKERVGYGDWISKFVKSITQADLILVVISEKYLRSVYCMTELHGIYERSGRDKKEFLERVIPLTLDEVRIGSVKDRLPHAKHWRAEVEAIRGELDEFGAEDFQQYRAMKRWQNDVSDMLAFVSDVLRPQGFQDVVADDYRGLREMLRRKRAGGEASATTA